LLFNVPFQHKYGYIRDEIFFSENAFPYILYLIEKASASLLSTFVPLHAVAFIHLSRRSGCAVRATLADLYI